MEKMFINEKWIENLGMENPTSVEEFIDVLRAIKEKDANGNGDPNDEIPLLFPSADINALLPIYGVAADVQNTHCILEDGKLGKYLYNSEEYKGYLGFLRQLYEEGLLYDQTFVATSQQVMSLARSENIAGAIVHSGASYYLGQNDHSLEYNFLLPFNGGRYPSRAAGSAGAFVITDACEHPELAMAWADNMYSEEISALSAMGIEGTTYKIGKDGDKEYIERLVSTDVEDGHKLTGGPGLPYVMPELSYIYTPDPKVQSAQDHHVMPMEAGVDIMAPVLKYSIDDGKKVAQINADIKPYVAEYLAKVVTGEYDLEETWDDYVQTLKDMKVDEYYALAEKAYELYDSTVNK